MGYLSSTQILLYYNSTFIMLGVKGGGVASAVITGGVI